MFPGKCREAEPSVWPAESRPGAMWANGAALLSSVPAEEQAEFQQLSDEIQELQQLLNQDFRQKTVCVLGDLDSEKSVCRWGREYMCRPWTVGSTGGFAALPRMPVQLGGSSMRLREPKTLISTRASHFGTTALLSSCLGCRKC